MKGALLPEPTAWTSADPLVPRFRRAARSSRKGRGSPRLGGRRAGSSRGARRRCSSAIAPPASRPQNAAPMPANATPAAVTTNVTAAASRAAGVGHRRRQRGRQRTEQRQPRDRLDQHRRGRAGSAPSPARRPRPSAASPTPAVDRGDPAAAPVGVRVGARGERGADRGQVHRVPAEGRRGERRPAPVATRIGAQRGPVAVGREHRHARACSATPSSRGTAAARHPPASAGSNRGVVHSSARREVRSAPARGPVSDDPDGRDDQRGRHRPRPGEPRRPPPSTTTTGAASSGTSATAATGARHSGSSTPASIAAGDRRRDRARSSRPERPDQAREHDQRAAQQERPDRGGEPAGLRSGGDQQRRSGRRPGDADRHPRAQPEHHRDDPRRRHTASSPDAACRSSAPTARSPASTTGNAPPNPTSAVTTPASTGRSTSRLTWSR